MARIYETTHFTLESHEHPEIDRLEWGHIKINPKRPVKDRTWLNPEEAIELMRFTIVAGKAMMAGMKQQGVEIGRINYQDNGNWKPELHIHLYGRATTATIQRYWDPLTPWHQPSFQALTPKDQEAIAKECDRLFALDEFQDSVWKL